MFFGIGQGFENLAQLSNADFLGTGLSATQFAQQSILHGVAGGTIAHVQGGKFGHGFLSAGVSKAATPGIMDTFNHSVSQGIAVAIVGGTVSEVTGGKFANGAVTAAMAFAFNHLSSWLSSGYNASANNYHEYEFDFELCNMSSDWCTVNAAYEALTRHAYPGQNPSVPVEEGIYPVRALGIELGDIEVVPSPNTNSIFNITAENHLMYRGHVHRQIIVKGGTINVRTFGAGNNEGFTLPLSPTERIYVSPAAAAQINQRLGPAGFRRLNNSMRDYMRPD